MKQQTFRFGLPPAIASAESAAKLSAVLGARLNAAVDVRHAESYQALGSDLLAGKLDAAWAPPFICARIEAMGARILVRGVRRGTSSYRSALLCRADVDLSVEKLSGLSAAWVDRDSVAGYLLPMAFLKAKGVNAKSAFPFQQFVGSYRSAVEALVAGTVDVSAVFAPPAAANVPGTTGVEEVAPQAVTKVKAWAFTEESPNDAVAVSMNTPPVQVEQLEQLLLSLHERPEGKELLAASFHAEKFERSPRMAYRALYRVALAGI